MSDDRASRNKAVVQRLFDEVWNARRLDVIDELYAEDYVVDYRPYAPCERVETQSERWWRGPGKRSLTTARS